MNVNFKPFDSKLGRQAINYALDTHVMLKHIYDGNGAVVNGPLGSTWVCFDPKIKRYPDNLKRPRELLGKAGYANGLEIKLYFAPDRHLKGNEVCEVIANQAGKVGIKVDLVSQEYAVSRRKDGVNRGNCRFTTPVAAAAMPIAISNRIFAPVCRRKSTTAIRNSTSSLMRSKNRRSKKARGHPTAGVAYPDGGRSVRAAVFVGGDLRLGQKDCLERYSRQ